MFGREDQEANNSFTDKEVNTSRTRASAISFEAWHSVMAVAAMMTTH